jgi:hypothetical protein
VIVSRLPAGCEVVLLVGKIDCREGLLVAVEKMKVGHAFERRNMLHVAGSSACGCVTDCCDCGCLSPAVWR